MRLWHYQMIPVLPRQQLIAQWRELSAIVGNIQSKGSPNHILVNKIMDYPMEHLVNYAALVRSELLARNYKPTDKVWEKIQSVCPEWKTLYSIFENWHNERYYTQCYYNLQEKYECGGISKEEWERIGTP